MFFDDPSREITQKELKESQGNWDTFLAFRWLATIFVFIPFVIYFFTR